MATRLLWLAAAALALGLGLWSGLARLGGVIPPFAPHHVPAHGPLMIGGFLGTLIALERALALGRRWGYLAPTLAAASIVWTTLEPDWRPAAWLLTAASLALCSIFGEFLRRRDDPATRTMALASLAWLLGNFQWAASGLVLVAVPWWVTFVVLAFIGRRLELPREATLPPRATWSLVACLLLLLGGLITAYVYHGLGLRGFGAGLVGIATWSLRWDSSSSSSEIPEGSRWRLLTLQSAYLWLAIAGAIMLLWGNGLGGLRWDAALHALFLGFVFSMIFAHTPIAMRVIFRLNMKDSPAFYLHIAVLHLSLLLRVGGDLMGSAEGRALGATLNMVAIALFLLNTLRAIIIGSLQGRPRPG